MLIDNQLRKSVEIVLKIITKLVIIVVWSNINLSKRTVKFDEPGVDRLHSEKNLQNNDRSESFLKLLLIGAEDLETPAGVRDRRDPTGACACAEEAPRTLHGKRKVWSAN